MTLWSCPVQAAEAIVFAPRSWLWIILIAHCLPQPVFNKTNL